MCCAHIPSTVAASHSAFMLHFEQSSIWHRIQTQTQSIMGVKSLSQRLKDGDFIIDAEGYLFEFERRGYVQAGPYTPEVVLDKPHLVKYMYEEFVHAGSDVVEAFTYYAHREKLRVVDREHDLEALNRKALQMAREVADKTGTLMAGNICNSTLFDRNDPTANRDKIMEMHKESLNWAVAEGADFIIAETLGAYGEASLALQCIKQYAPGLESVIMLVPDTVQNHKLCCDGADVTEAIVKLAAQGATVVGLNCHHSPSMVIDFLTDVRQTYKGPLAALPVPYQTTNERPHFFNLITKKTGKRAFPHNLDQFLSPVDDIIQFGHDCKRLNVQFLGLCCGNSSRFTRALAESLGRKPPASRYSPNMTLHWNGLYFDEKAKSSCFV